MDIDAKLKSTQDVYKYREVQYEQLLHYLSLRDTHNIVAYGPRATCKTSLVRAIVDQLQLVHAWINVLHYVAVRNIYESILSQIKRQLELKRPPTATQPELDTTCNNSIVFIEKLEILLNELTLLNQDHAQKRDRSQSYKHKLVLVLDNVDVLFKDDNNHEVIYLMNNLEQLTRQICPISVVYISTHSVEWMMRHSEFKSASLQVVFNNYSNDELLHLLTSRALLEGEYSQDLYSNYVNIILRSLTPFTRNFSELQNICHRNFGHFIRPIEEDELTSKELNRLYLRFQPRIQEIIANLSDHKIVRLKASIEMSPSMSYLLVGAYLASYNSVKSDKRYFVRNQGRFKERRKRIKHAEPEAKPPKPFTFERVFNIYQALLNLNEIDRTTRSHLMISSLVSQQFNELIKQNLIFALKSVNNTAFISSISKYQLSDMVTVKHIEDIATSIRLNLKAFTEAT